MPRPIRATISLPALSHNLQVVRNHLQLARQDCQETTGKSFGSPFIWAVIKANAYGHGLENGIKGFGQADGLALIDLNDAIRCREKGWDKKILMLEGFFEQADLPYLQENHITTSIHHIAQIKMLEKMPAGKPFDVFLKLNTGMNRLGFRPADCAARFQDLLVLQKQGRVGKIGFMSHFSSADGQPGAIDEPARLMMQAIEGLPGALSMCNSAATLRYPSLAFNERENWVRPGICLYGASPFDTPTETATAFGLRPAMSLKAKLLSVQHVEKGESVGYGATFTATQNTRVGVVACGYADGYPRHAPTGTPVVVNGVRTRIIGRVSMDMLTVDLDPVPDAREGDWVNLWGHNGPHIDEVASHAGTISYELMCALAKRVPVDLEE
ncbi:alanine racemase [Advenella faeciporci]|uniref:Alanine racemase n=1 Tax=Advenella faeciporci TaxID=797535 RepID=A0A918MWQ5_9BURK|nr:alanine racemase [Advenella faeciporci]GGW79468.1 alanine racemase [Advenella faeciporci]